MLVVVICFSDDADRMHGFLFGRALAATATAGQIVFETFRIHFFCQCFSVQPGEQSEKTAVDAVLERTRSTVPVKNAD